MKKQEYVKLIAKSGNIVHYPLDKFVEKSLIEIARDLGYNSIIEFILENMVSHLLDLMVKFFMELGESLEKARETLDKALKQ